MKEPVALLPLASAAVHVTVVEPIGNVPPEGGVHVTVGAGSVSSDADTAYATVAPFGLVACTDLSVGRLSTPRRTDAASRAAVQGGRSGLTPPRPLFIHTAQ